MADTGCFLPCSDAARVARLSAILSRTVSGVSDSSFHHRLDYFPVV